MNTYGIDTAELVDNGLAEAAGLISRREYNLSVVRTRQTAEFLIKSYAAERGISYTTLADTIEALYQQGIINRTSRDAFHNIRIFGNMAVHDGNNDPENAQKAYYLLKAEISTYLSRKTVNVDRTPVRVDNGADKKKDISNIEIEMPASGEKKASGRRDRAEDAYTAQGKSERRRDKNDYGFDLEDDEALIRDVKRRINGGERDRERRGDTARSTRNGGNRKNNTQRRSGNSNNRNRRPQNGRNAKRRTEEPAQFSVYDLLRILLPVIVIILLIVIIRSFMASKKPVETEAQTATVIETVAETTEAETTTEPETTEPETTAAPVYEYKTNTDGVNIRYADDQNRIYTQLPKDTNIGTVTPIDGSDFASFTLDGVNVVVNKNFIVPVE